MGHDPVHRHLAGAHRRHHPAEIGGGGVAACLQGHFLPVEVGVEEADRVLDHADQHIAAAVGRRRKAGLHRRAVARGVHHDVEAVAAGHLRTAAAGSGAVRQRLGPGDRARRKGARLVAVEDLDLAACEPGEQRDAQSDRAPRKRWIARMISSPRLARTQLTLSSTSWLARSGPHFSMCFARPGVCRCRGDRRSHRRTGRPNAVSQGPQFLRVHGAGAGGLRRSGQTNRTRGGRPVVPLVAATYPLRDIAAAQEAFGEKRHYGKIVLEMH